MSNFAYLISKLTSHTFRHLRLILRSASAVAITLALFAGHASATVPPAPIGLDVDGAEFALVSNASSGWRVSSDGGETFGPVRAAVILRKTPAPGAKGAFDRQPYAFIWAPTCTTAQQTLIFRRTYFLPGRPKTIFALLSDTTYQSAPANQAISSAKIYINGKPAFAANGASIRTGNGSPAVLPQTKLFVFGENTIDVVVVKRALEGIYGHCKNNFTPPTPLGIAFVLQGKFEADLWVAKDSATQESWRRVSVPGNLHQPFFVGVAPRNLGPSGIYKGTLSLDFSGGNLLVDKAVTITGAGLRNCIVTQPSVGSAHMQCEIFKMPAGASATASFKVVAQYDYTFDFVYAFLYSTISVATYDPNLNTNSVRKFYYFCSSTSTYPKCPPA